MQPISSYLDYSGRDDVLSGGARKIPVSTPAGVYSVWVKRTGNNPRLRVLLLHGGPGSTHEYLEACDSWGGLLAICGCRRPTGPSRCAAASTTPTSRSTSPCPEGSHLSMYDDQRVYFAGLIDFLRSL